MSRIALLTSEFLPFHGGIGAYARELALAAVTAGHEVTLLAPNYGTDCREIDTALPFQVKRYASSAATMYTLPKRIVETHRLLAREQFDIVHAVDWPFFIPLRITRRLLHGARVVLTVHGSEILYMKVPKRRRMLDAIHFWEHDWCEWAANSRYTAELLLRSFPRVSAARVKVTPLGLNPSWKAGRLPRNVARASLGLELDRIVMVSLGRVVPRKGHGVVAEALALVPVDIAKRIDWWVIGPLLDEAHVNELRAATQGLPNRTAFLGSLPDTEVKQRLSAADFFCLPGYTADDGSVEGFGLVFLEAGAYGLPSIASQSGGIPEAVEDGATGLLVPERDAFALAAAIKLMVVNEALRGQLAKAAEAKADAATWDLVMRGTY